MQTKCTQAPLSRLSWKPISIKLAVFHRDDLLKLEVAVLSLNTSADMQGFGRLWICNRKQLPHQHPVPALNRPSAGQLTSRWPECVSHVRTRVTLSTLLTQQGRPCAALTGNQCLKLQSVNGPITKGSAPLKLYRVTGQHVRVDGFYNQWHPSMTSNRTQPHLAQRTNH